MPAPAHVQTLEAAEFILGAPHIKGIPIWRSAGLRAVDLLVERFVALAGGSPPPEPRRHAFLADGRASRRVFGTYDNVYDVLDLPGRPEAQFRSDNIVANIGELREAGAVGPVVSTGEVVRDAPGKTPPLFRDRHVWPVVELNHLVAPGEAAARLAAYAKAVVDLLGELGIPALTVQTPALASYGKLSYLVVAVLPDRRPTVLATLYVLNDTLRVALDVALDVIDVGFTGKILATVAMLHADVRGLLLPSRIAPVQVGVTRSAAVDAGPWLADLRAAGLRCAVTVADRPAGRARAERRWHRRGVPLVIGLDGSGAPTVTTRLPLRRFEPAGLGDPDRIRALLAESDARLAERAERVFDAAMTEGGHRRSWCRPCAGRAGEAVFGTVLPHVPARCESCGDPAGEQLFISAEGRFY